MSDEGTTLEVDVVVIGGGPTGENVADRAARGGLEVALVERELVGGECSYWACIPSKTLLQPGRVLRAARNVTGAAAAVTGTIDAAQVLARRDRSVAELDDSAQVKWLEDRGIRLVRGQGRIAGARRVEIVSTGDPTRRTLVARHAVAVCTGTVAAVPPALAAARPWTNREATGARAVPRRLVVVGGGPVACELAQAWRWLGADEVTLVVRADRLLGRAEPRAAELVEAALRSDGIDVRLGTTVASASRREDGTVEVVPEGGQPPIVADELLAATGRRPATGDIGLEVVGLEPGSWLDVDDSLAVQGVDGGWLYAAGDVNHRALLTHMGKYQGRACGDAIVARAAGDVPGSPSTWSARRAPADHRAVAQVVFTDPEVAAVGLTEHAARDAGLPVRVVDYDLSHIGAASLVADDFTGWARLVVDDERRVVVGATFVGPDVAELLHSATVAIVGEVTLDRLWHAVPSFPTISEVWLRLLEDYGL